MKKIYLFMLMAVGLLISGNLRATVQVSSVEEMKDALSQAADGVLTEIELTGNIESSSETGGALFTIGQNKVVVLDLKGFTISYQITQKKSGCVFANNGDFTIKNTNVNGEGAIESHFTGSGQNHPTIENHKTLTILSGTIASYTTESYSAYAIDNMVSSSYLNVAENIVCNIEGGKILRMVPNGSGGYKFNTDPAIRLYDAYVNTLKNITINISGGTIEGGRAIYVHKYNNATMNINITGGTLKSSNPEVDARRCIDIQSAKNNTDYSKITVNINKGSEVPHFIGGLWLNDDANSSNSSINLENVEITDGVFESHNAMRPTSTTAKMSKFIKGGIFFFDKEKGLRWETVIPYILLDQEDAQGKYSVDHSGYSKYYGLDTEEAWTNLGYRLVPTTFDAKEGDWYAVQRQVDAATEYPTFKTYIADGYTAVDITGTSEGRTDGQVWPDKTVIVKKVDEKEITTNGELENVSKTDAVVIKSGANVTIGDNTTSKTFEVYSLNVEDGSLTIGSKATVIVGDGGFVGNEQGENALCVTINSTDGSTGIVKVSPNAPKTKQKVKVNLYTSAHSTYKNDQIAVSYWQLFARPTELDVESFGVVSFEGAGQDGEITYSELITNVYGYDGNHWVQLQSIDQLSKKFEGYAISNNSKKGGVVYQFTGWMCLNNDAELKFNHGGFTLMGNSYLAPMSITSIFEQMPNQGSETTSTEQTIWYYESEYGSYKQVTLWMSQTEEDSRYTQIEPMQGFFMYLAKGSSLNAELSYADAVWNQTLVAHPLPAPALGAKTMNMAKITVSADGKNDEMRVYEDNDFSPAFDNGADATKMMNLSGMFNLYVATEGKNYANFATDNLEGTILTFNANAQREYTLSFSNANIDYQLVDLLTGEKIEMTEGNTYTFMAEPNSTVERFQIVPAAMAPTAIKNTKSAVANKVMKNGMLLIERNNQIYTVQGQNVK